MLSETLTIKETCVDMDLKIEGVSTKYRQRTPRLITENKHNENNVIQKQTHELQSQGTHVPVSED